MSKESIQPKRDRLSIDVPTEVHLQIKVYATLHGKSIRDYILESVQERLLHDLEAKQMLAMTTHASPALQALWDNVKDASYDTV